MRTDSRRHRPGLHELEKRFRRQAAVGVYNQCRMQEEYFDPAAEPFGQRGVLPLLWPTLVVLCTIGLCTSLLMLQRSKVIYDMVSNTTSTRQTVVASLTGRLVVTVLPGGNGSDAPASEWSFDSRVFDSIQDGWRESWQKTIGIEWGDEALRQYNKAPIICWRLRIRWRTLAILYAIPVVIEVSRRARRRLMRPLPMKAELHTTTA